MTPHIKLTDHCSICTNKLVQIKTGTICGLTNKKANFIITCPKIILGDFYFERIKKVNVEYQLIKKSKWTSYIVFTGYLLITIAVVTTGYLLGVYAFDNNVISTVPIIVMGAGFLIMPVSTGALIQYLQSMAIAKKQKNKLDNLLLLYDISYEVILNIQKDRHGNKDIEATITFTNTDGLEISKKII